MQESQTAFFQTAPNNTRTTNLLNQLNGQNRIRQLKNHLKQLSSYHTRAVSEVIKSKKSMGELSRSTQKTKISFMRLYESKKMKLMNKQKVQNKQMEDQQRQKQTMKRVKEKKLIDEFQLEATRHEEKEKNETRKELFKKQKEKRKKEIKVNNLQSFVEARNTCRRMKEHRSQIMDRNKKIDEIIFMKGKYNYADKTEKELEQIRAYELLLAQLQGIEHKQKEWRPMTAATRSFFVTNMPAYAQPTQEKPLSTRATYRAKRHA